MRDRLIELIRKIPYGVSVGAKFEQYFCELVADHLLQEGVIVPPVNIGETVYYIFSNSSILELKVASIEIAPFETFGIVLRCYGGISFYERDIGKTVFFTKEEAEQALKGGEQG